MTPGVNVQIVCGNEKAATSLPIEAGAGNPGFRDFAEIVSKLFFYKNKTRSLERRLVELEIERSGYEDKADSLEKRLVALEIGKTGDVGAPTGEEGKMSNGAESAQAASADRELATEIARNALILQSRNMWTIKGLLLHAHIAAERRSIFARRSVSAVALDRVARSGLFDREIYLLDNPDVRAAGLDPLRHYLIRGWREMRSPHPLFDPVWYLATYDDVLRGGIEPLTHYIAHGAKEGRDPNPLFHTKWYAEKYANHLTDGENPLAHFIRVGASQSFWPHPLFDPDYYRTVCTEDFGGTQWKLLEHYLRFGLHQGVRPSRYFDPIWYLQANPTAVTGALNPLRHYLDHGAHQGLNPALDFDAAGYAQAHPEIQSRGEAPLVHFYHGTDV